MTSPSTPTTPGSHSRGTLYKQGTIISIDGTVAVVRTTLTETLTVRRDIMRSKGRLPEVGETWMLTKEFGYWVFSLILVGGDKSNLVPQEDIVGLDDALDDIDGHFTSIDGAISTLDTRADQSDVERAYLYRWLNNGASFEEAYLYGDLLSSLSRFSSLQSVAVAGAGRYINLGLTPGAYLFSGCKLYVSAALGGASIQIGLYAGSAISSLTQVRTASVSAASGGPKSGTFGSPYTSVPGQLIMVGLATTAGTTVAVSGCENGIVNELRGQVADLGGTSLLSTVVMGPTSPHTVTQGRHWVSLF